MPGFKIDFDLSVEPRCEFTRDDVLEPCKGDGQATFAMRLVCGCMAIQCRGCRVRNEREVAHLMDKLLRYVCPKCRWSGMVRGADIIRWTAL